MQPHVKNYLEHYGYDVGDWIKCQNCPKTSVDIHHIHYRSHFGKKKKNEQDHWTNLIALCRKCHDMAHNEEISKESLKAIINDK